MAAGKMGSPRCLPNRGHIRVNNAAFLISNFKRVKSDHLGLRIFLWNFRYLAPEYFMHGIVDEKTDVFAFGVLLLELITGRRAVDSSRQSLVIWVCFC